jgi:hypothetical protein
MARFKFYLIGSCDAPVLDVAVADLHELNAQMSCNRFVEGHMTEVDADGVLQGVLIATSRVQLVMDV